MSLKDRSATFAPTGTLASSAADTGAGRASSDSSSRERRVIGDTSREPAPTLTRRAGGVETPAGGRTAVDAPNQGRWVPGRRARGQPTAFTGADCPRRRAKWRDDWRTATVLNASACTDFGRRA